MLQRFVLHHHHVARCIMSQHAALQRAVAQRCSLSLVQEGSLAARPSVRARVRVVVRACMRGSGGCVSRCACLCVRARVRACVRVRGIMPVCVLRLCVLLRVRLCVRVRVRASGHACVCTSTSACVRCAHREQPAYPSACAMRAHSGEGRA